MYPSPKASVTIQMVPRGSYATRGTIHVPVHLASKGAYSSVVVEIEQSLYSDVEMNNGWLSDAVDDDSSESKYIIIRCFFHSCM